MLYLQLFGVFQIGLFGIGGGYARRTYDPKIKWWIFILG